MADPRVGGARFLHVLIACSADIRPNNRYVSSGDAPAEPDPWCRLDPRFRIRPSFDWLGYHYPSWA